VQLACVRRPAVSLTSSTSLRTDAATAGALLAQRSNQRDRRLLPELKKTRPGGLPFIFFIWVGIEEDQCVAKKNWVILQNKHAKLVLSVMIQPQKWYLCVKKYKWYVCDTNGTYVVVFCHFLSPVRFFKQ
jgi:hypothetical protein